MRIYINDIELDIPVQVALSYSIASFSDPGRAQGFGSKTITVARTKTVEKAFGLTYNSIITTDINKSVAQDCIIKEDSVTILKGKAKLLTASLTEVEFECRGNNATLKDLLGDLTLNDLDLSDLDHDYSNATVLGTWASPPDDYFYPLIDYGHLHDRDASVTDTTAVDLYPAVYVRRLISQIFLQQGIAIETTFFRRVEMSKLLMAFSGAFVQNDAWVADRGFRASLSLAQVVATSNVTIQIDNDSTSPNFDTGGNFDISSHRYTASEGMKLDIHLVYSISATSGVSTLKILKNGVTVLESTATSVGNNQYLSALNVELAAGDYISVVGDSSGSYTITAASLYNEVKPDIILGSTVHMSSVVPQMKQIDLIRYCVGQFNWLIDFDRATMDTWKDFFSGVEDWTDKLDLTQPPVVSYISDEVAQIFGFKYAENDSFNILNWNEQNKAIFGDGEYNTGNDYQLEPNDLEFPLAATMISPSYINGSKYLKIPQIIKDENNIVESTEVKPRFLIYAGNQTVSVLADGSYGSIRINNGGSTTSPTVPLCYFVKPDYSAYPNEVAGIDAFKVNLCFDLPAGSWNGRGLIDEFYENLSNYEDLRIVDAWFNLKSSDINQLNFKKYKYINLEGFTGNYILMEVEEYDGLSSTKCKLLKVWQTKQ